MAIPARLLRSFLPALVGAGLVLAACSSDSDEPKGPDTLEPGDGGSDSSGGGTAGTPTETPEAGSPSGGSGGSGASGGSGGTSAAGGEEPGTGGTPTEPGTGGAAGEAAGPTEPTPGFLHGKEIYEEKCIVCHGTDLGGSRPFANISSHMVYGIGSWTDEEIAAAINEGVDPGKPKLCTLMVPFPEITGTDMAGLIEFLRGSSPVDREIAECTIGDP